MIGLYEYESGTSSNIYFQCVSTAYTIRKTSSNNFDGITKGSKENYQATTTFLYDATRIDINDAVVSAIPDQRWSNSPATPAFTVTYNDDPLPVEVTTGTPRLQHLRLLISRCWILRVLTVLRIPT